MNTPLAGHQDDDLSAYPTKLPAPLRVLVVDDDFEVRQYCAVALAQFGYQVDTAEDAVAGWKALNASPYSLLITDHRMPRLSGVELINLLRSARMSLPVVLATGAIPSEEISRYPRLELNATLLKPYTVEMLLKTVEQVLKDASSPYSSLAVSSPVLPEQATQRQAL